MKSLLLIEAKYSILSQKESYLTWNSSFEKQLKTKLGWTEEESSETLVSRMFELDFGLQDYAHNIIQQNRHINSILQRTENLQIEDFDQILSNVSSPLIQEDERTKPGLVYDHVLFNLDWCFNSDDLHEQSQNYNTVFLYEELPDADRRETLWAMVIQQHRFPGIKLILYRTGQMFKDLKNCGFNQEDLNNSTTKIVSTNPNRFVEHSFDVFNLGIDTFDFKQNMYYHGSWISKISDVKLLSKNIDKLNIFSEIATLKQLLPKQNMMEYVYQDYEKRFGELIIVGWNFTSTKIKFATVDKKICIDKFPLSFRWYDVWQERDNQSIKFLIHNYSSLEENDDTRIKFGKFWEPRGLLGDNSVVFIDDYKNIKLTNDKQYFLHQLGFDLDLKNKINQYALRNQIEKTIELKIPSSFTVEKIDYQNIDTLLKQRNFKFPVIFKSKYVNFDEVYIVNNAEAINKVCEEMHVEGYGIQIQQLIPHFNTIFKVYYFCGKFMCDKRYSLPSVEKIKSFGDYTSFSKKKPLLDATNEELEMVKESELPSELFEIISNNISKKYDFHCFGYDVLLKENTDNQKEYYFINFNRLTDYGNNQGLDTIFYNFVMQRSKKTIEDKGFKLESAWAEIDPIGKTELELQKEILEKVKKLKEEGNKFFRDKGYHNAIVCWERAFKSFEFEKQKILNDVSVKDEFNSIMTILLSNLGRAYYEVKNYDNAKACMKGAIKNIEGTKDTMKYMLSNLKVYRNLANIYQQEKSCEEARKIMKQAVIILSKVSNEEKMLKQYGETTESFKVFMEKLDKEIERNNNKLKKSYKGMFDNEIQINSKSLPLIEDSKEEVKNNKDNNGIISKKGYVIRSFLLSPLVFGGSGQLAWYGLEKLERSNPGMITKNTVYMCALATAGSFTGISIMKDKKAKLAFGGQQGIVGLYLGNKLLNK